ncbi:type II secretion system protein [Psychrobacillus sp. FSL K6-1464]|uniref:type II secretion system protein n=1 Tax=Psychrobacillus sp. FSL K6-1464 TaxID=2921545 RepID=UPI0030F943E6
MKKFMKIFKNEKGLTLIELLAVIVILAIVAAIATPAIGNIIANSRDKAILADASTILSGAKLAVADGACTEIKTAAGSDKVGDYKCTTDQLKPYVDGITLTTNDAVTKTVDTITTGTSPVTTKGIWTVKYANLVNIKNTSKFTVAAATPDPGFTPGNAKDTITEISLNKAMNQ